ncbi:MAG: hypothetical protein AAFP17_05555 [Pseudomonadota bacterium]
MNSSSAYFFARRVRRWLAILALPVGLGVMVHHAAPAGDGIALLREGVPAEARVISLKAEDREGSWLIGKRYTARLWVLGERVERGLGAARFGELTEGGLATVTVVPERPGAVDISRGQTLLDAAKGLIAGLILAAVGLYALIVTWRRNTGRWRVSE